MKYTIEYYAMMQRVMIAEVPDDIIAKGAEAIYDYVLEYGSVIDEQIEHENGSPWFEPRPVTQGDEEE
tara:strand:+ start:5149 stop:5352 length:204 start_codon:yes stop_codon:yes gene_type:complete